MDIQFGTDGWRARIADTYTFENVRKVAHATALFWKSEKRKNLACYSWKPGTYACTYRPAENGLVVGYDARFLSEDFAKEAAKILQAHGIPVFFSKTLSPTPTTSFAVANQKLSGGIMITASHNPYQWNGFKIKMEFGGSALPEITQGVEEELKLLGDQKLLSVPGPKSSIQEIDLISPYFSELGKKVDLEAIQKKKFKIISDPMFGTNVGLTQKLLPQSEVIELHGARDAFFGGLNPEPIDLNLRELMQRVPKENGSVGLAFDGDGDRIGAVDENGNFLSSHEIFCLLLWHLAKHKKWTGAVAKTYSTTNRVKLLADYFKLPFHETPIGFKYIAKLFLTEDLLIGGEESGGIGIKNHVPERDSLLNALLLLELMSITNKRLGEILNDIHKTIGFFFTDRIDLTIPSGSNADPVGPQKGRSTDLRPRMGAQTVLSYLKSHVPSQMEGTKVTETSELDGIKYHLNGGAWILFRPSGTEPLVRIYAEAGRQDLVRGLLREGKKMVEEATHVHASKS